MENSVPRSYSCLMLDMSFLTNELKAVQENICPCDVYDLEKGHGLEDEFHCTALYGLHTDKASLVTSEVKLTPVKFRIGKLSLFENEKYDVLKFEIHSSDLHRINKELREKLEYTNNFPKYIAHATVGYLMPGAGRAYTKLKNDLTGKTFTSNKFIFSDQQSNKVIISV